MDSDPVIADPADNELNNSNDVAHEPAEVVTAPVSAGN
jgi:hypothetical protein